MKIQNIEISGVGGIDNLFVSFDPSMNIICGPNGIGKTTVLECIAHCFTNGKTNILKRNVRSSKSCVSANIGSNDNFRNVKLEFSVFEPDQQAHVAGYYEKSKYLLSLKTTRIFAYQPLNSVNKDSDKPAHILWGEAQNGVSLNNIKNWFVNRYLYSAHSGALKQEQIKNFSLAKKCFSALNESFQFSKVDASTNEIIVATPSGEIYYEYLSSGFKSCLSILFGIIKEVEFRFSDSEMDAGNFDGVVLIDEVELHLHPDWQSRIRKTLTEIFPNVQFIITTHSPHVIQSAEPNQIKVLENKNGKVILREMPESKYGFKNWTLDEVLTDVMGMTDTRTKEFKELMNFFGRAVDSEDYDAAKKIFDELNLSLHPDSTVRKLLRIQLESIVRG